MIAAVTSPNPTNKKILENKDPNLNIISNNNTEQFGEIIDKKCLLWGIKNNIICDYVIQTMITDECNLEYYRAEYFQLLQG